MAAILEARGPDYREEAVSFGSERHLVGILSQPLGASDDRPCAVFLNAGVIHRIGPHRLHVVLARRLAGRGWSALRLDLSGVGDSRVVAGAPPYRERAVLDARTAMDAVADRLGARRFVVLGLCSGADNAVAVALADARVSGVVLLDPHAYATARSRLRRLAARVGRPGAAGALLRAAARGAGAVLRPRRATDAQAADARETPPAKVYGAQLEALAARGVRILSVFSGALGERYNHPDQLFEVFPQLRGRADRLFLPDANHTFTEMGVQARLAASVGEWLDGAFGPAGG
jgi:hypothetical protein